MVFLPGQSVTEANGIPLESTSSVMPERYSVHCHTGTTIPGVCPLSVICSKMFRFPFSF